MRKKFLISVCIFAVFFAIGITIASQLNLSGDSVTEIEKTLDRQQNDMLLCLKILGNNLLYCVLSLLGVGLLTAFMLAFQGFQMGTLLGIWIGCGYTALDYVWLIAPHGVIELTGWFIFCAIGMDLFIQIRKYLHGETFQFLNWIIDKKRYIRNATLLIIIAAIVEAYITPWIYAAMR